MGDGGLGIRDCTWPEEGNRKSVRVAEKLGFVDGGVVRSVDGHGGVEGWGGQGGFGEDLGIA